MPNRMTCLYYEGETHYIRFLLSSINLTRHLVRSPRPAAGTLFGSVRASLGVFFTGPSRSSHKTVVFFFLNAKSRHERFPLCCSASSLNSFFGFVFFFLGKRRSSEAKGKRTFYRTGKLRTDSVHAGPHAGE